MRVVAFDTAHPGIYYYVDTEANKTAYLLDGLPPGSYHVVAYGMNKLDLAGGYTAMVPCGLSASCTDHSLLDVNVQAGKISGNIDPGDWYAPPGSLPPNPQP
jgi:hypothetical protein